MPLPEKEKNEFYYKFNKLRIDEKVVVVWRSIKDENTKKAMQVFFNNLRTEGIHNKHATNIGYSRFAISACNFLVVIKTNRNRSKSIAIDMKWGWAGN